MLLVFYLEGKWSSIRAVSRVFLISGVGALGPIKAAARLLAEAAPWVLPEARHDAARLDGATHA